MAESEEGGQISDQSGPTDLSTFFMFFIREKQRFFKTFGNMLGVKDKS